MSYILRLIAHLPGGEDWKSYTFDTIPQAEKYLATAVDDLARKHYDIAPHGFEKITAVIKDGLHGGDPVVTFVYTREMFESAHRGEVIKFSPCGCWLTAGAGRWQSNGQHEDCTMQSQPAFAI